MLSLVLWAVTVFAATQSSVSQYGITWTFDKAYEVGQFVNGDYWVVGPVTIQSVSPAPSGGRNGSMINPSPNTNTFDDRVANYNAGLGISFPKVLQPKQSLVSSISNPEASNCMAGPHAGWLDDRGHCYLGKLKTAAVLTCVSEAKPATSFRPPWCGSSYKPYFSTGDVCWDLLPKLTPTPIKPSASDVLRDFERPWIDHFTGYTGRRLHPTMNLPDYGREIGYMVSRGALYLMLDLPEVEQVAVRYIQLGIDNYGIVKAGGAWGVDGGHLNGRKWPTVFAGMMLDDAAMKSPGKYANEDGMTYYGNATAAYPGGKPLWGSNCTSCYLSNGCKYGGSCTRGSKTCRDPAKQRDACSDYIGATSPTWVGEALAGRIMRAEPHWGNNAFFDYVDRYVKEGGLGANFQGQMWLTYRNNLPPAGSCPVDRITDASAMDRKIAVQVMPNPMTDHIVFKAESPQRGGSTVTIFDQTGNTVYGPSVKTLAVRWDGTDRTGRQVKPGIYFYSIQTSHGIGSGRIIKTR